VASLRWCVIGGLVAFTASMVATVLALVALVIAGGLDLGSLEELDTGYLSAEPLLLIAAAAGLWFGFALAFVGATRARAIPLRAGFGPFTWWAAAGGFVGGVLLQLLLAVVAHASGSEGGLDVSGWSPATVLAFAVVAGVGAPLFEELYFRGVLLPTLARRLPVWVAVVVQAVLFGVLHVDQGVFGVAAITAVGLVLGWLRVVTRSLVAPIAVHAGFNAVAVLAVALHALG
jgi:membrane protease YdiL (CAAX protease family)